MSHLEVLLEFSTCNFNVEAMNEALIRWDLLVEVKSDESGEKERSVG